MYVAIKSSVIKHITRELMLSSKREMPEDRLAA